MARPSSSNLNSNSDSSKRSMRNLVGILKDKISLLKSTSSFHMAVIRATTHFPVDPPRAGIVEDVLVLVHFDRPTAFAVVDTLLRRLCCTKNAYVALKCQLTLHHVISRGSFASKERILNTVGPHNNVLNLSSFRDESDADTWELSAWVRWYAGILERGIICTRLLGFDFLSPLACQYRRIKDLEGISVRSSLRDLGSLVGFVEEISRSPESFNYQRISLIHEVVKLVGEDYRIIMREIHYIIAKIKNKTEGLTDDELNEFLVYLNKLEDCKEKVLLMFLNIKNTDGHWDFIRQTGKEVEKTKENRMCLRMVRFQGTGLGTIRLGGGGGGRGGEITPSKPRGKRWLDVAWNPLVVPQAC